MGIGLAACDGAPRTTAPDEALFQSESAAAPPKLPAPAAETRDELMALAATGSIRRLARRAEAEPVFLSNFGGADHLRHWDLMRRIGFDPSVNLAAVLSEPHASQQVGAQTWFVWPDLAVSAPRAIEAGALSSVERARLLALIGADGVAAMEAGAPYPGVRTAISETGAWRYFLHEPPDP
ncbi:MAG: hypothetical protein AAGH87_02230 [Pseudomonadota bacterium]